MITDSDTIRPWEELANLGARPWGQRAFAALWDNFCYPLVSMGDPELESQVFLFHLPICEGNLVSKASVKNQDLKDFRSLNEI